MGDVVEMQREQPTDQELTQEFVRNYREAMGLPPVDDPKTLKDGLGDGLKTYRYLEPGRQFAITSNPKIRDALLTAGAVRAVPYKPAPEAVEHFDIQLPSFLWQYL
jgi:hypothetical protein